MDLFCLLWVLLFFFFRRSVSSSPGGGYLWALLLGCIIVVFQYFTGPLAAPDGFGFSCWLSGFFDTISLPVIIPLVVCFLLIKLRVLPVNTDYADFTLLCLVPLAAFRAINQDSPRSLEFLAAVPVLWTAQAVGIACFIKLILKIPRWYVIIPSALAIVALPLVAATSWWMLFSHQVLKGSLLLLAGIIPGVISVVLDFIASKNYKINE